jgi:hypothetical protein
MDFIRCGEDRASVEERAHLEECGKCRRELARYFHFLNVAVLSYARMKELDAELDRELGSMDLKKMVPLPQDIAEKVKALEEKNLASRLKKIVGRNQERAQKFIENLLTPRPHAAPASPKDITKTKAVKRKKKTSKQSKSSKKK